MQPVTDTDGTDGRVQVAKVERHEENTFVATTANGTQIFLRPERFRRTFGTWAGIQLGSGGVETPERGAEVCVIDCPGKPTAYWAYRQNYDEANHVYSTLNGIPSVLNASLSLPS